MTNSTTQYPSLSDRIQAMFIDTLVVIFSIFIISSFMKDDTPDWVRITCFIAIWGMYEPFCTSFAGCTLGTYLKGLRVRQYQHQDQKINILQAYLRTIIKYFLGWLSFLTIHSNDEKRALHDLAAGTVVLKK